MRDTEASAEYLCPPGIGTAEVLTVLAGYWQLVESPPRTFSRVFYDTFDWALFTDGGMLERRETSNAEGRRADLLWSPVAHPSGPESELIEQPAPDALGFAEGLADGPVRARIIKVAGIRRLLPVMEIQTRARALRALDDEGETLWTAILEEGRFADPRGGGSGALPLRVRVLSQPDHAQAVARLLDELDSELGLVPAESPLLVAALQAAGRQPRDYSSKIDFHLDPDARADTVTKSILLGLLDTVERNREGARDNLDSEFLHDLRVAVRRTRSALTQIRPVLPEPVVSHYKERFAWVQQVTGPVRDLDVYLLDFGGYQASLPPALRPHLEPMRTFLLAHYDEEQRRLAETLDGAELRALLTQWRSFLEAQVPDAPEAKQARKPIKTVAASRIWRMAKRVRREGRAITSDSPPADRHELRKSCKKLRYLMEFFQSLYPEAEIRPLIRLLKDLLDNLGAFQDLSVQAAHLRELAERMRAEGHGDTDTLLAMGALIGQVLERQQQMKDAFSAVFDRFLDPDTQERLHRLFHSERRGNGKRKANAVAGVRQAAPLQAEDES